MTILYPFELLGTFFFAISGALAVQDHHDDLFGAGFLGFVTAIGGGTLRDMMLGSYPLVWIGDIFFLYSILAGVLVAYIFFNPLMRLKRTFLFFDTLGISFFTGQILLMEDVSGKGHKTRNIYPQRRKSLFITLPD